MSLVLGLFIDGVYRSRTGVGLSELGDIERVEVLRGPQGKLFGRNSTAGLINIVTKGPELGAFAGKGSISYGNYDYWRIDGMLNAPLGDKAAVRLKGVWQKRDGFIENVTPGEPDINDRDRWLIKGQLMFEPSETMSGGPAAAGNCRVRPFPLAMAGSGGKLPMTFSPPACGRGEETSAIGRLPIFLIVIAAPGFDD